MKLEKCISNTMNVDGTWKTLFQFHLVPMSSIYVILDEIFAIFLAK